MMKSLAVTCALLLSVAITTVNANRQMVVYWGQGPDSETELRNYCQDSSIDILVISFLHDFPFASGSQLPGLDVSSVQCKAFSKSNPKFMDCSKAVGPDITYCQQQGKKVILSLGGASGVIGFTSDAQAITAADTYWNMFLGGSYPQRPFGQDVILDGVDLDVEQGTSRGFAAFLTQLRSHFTAQTERTYIIGAAPQCPYPDDWMGPGSGTALQTAWFDYVWVQFYNNNCGLDKYPSSKFNFATWANWAKTTSINPNVQILIGAPASSDSAGSGYVSAATLKTIHDDMASKYPTIYGGMMLWEAATAKKNNDFAGQLAKFVHDGSAPTVPAPVPSSKTTTTTGSKSSTSTGRSRTTTTGDSSPVGSTTTTGKSAPVPTPVPTPPASSGGACAQDGYMKCLSSTSYSTCDHGVWSASQSCGSGTSCAANGDYIYCVNTISAPTDGGSNACGSNGWMKCASSNTYQICDHGQWTTPQSCAANLKCSPSGDYIYCTY